MKMKLLLLLFLLGFRGLVNGQSTPTRDTSLMPVDSLMLPQNDSISVRDGNEEYPLEINNLTPTQRLMRTKLLQRKSEERKNVELLFFCELHPDIISDSSGICPVC